MTFAERAHEIGREGSIRAKRLLQQLLGSSIDLPFNAYDHPRRLSFEDSTPEGHAGATFCFDLGGVLQRPNPNRYDGTESADIFVEVKSRSTAGDLLAEYREFMRRAAVVTALGRHDDVWFVFYSTTPFGCSRARDLTSGALLEEEAAAWPPTLQTAARKLQTRLILVIASESMAHLMTKWGADAS